MVFLLHHANLDRNAMTWQANALRLNVTMGDASVMWGYPASSNTYPQSFPGCYLHNVITSNFPFEDIFVKQNNPITHFDILDKTRPGNSLYRYDTLP